jgi:osmoprotectant transport system permease protein
MGAITAYFTQNGGKYLDAAAQHIGISLISILIAAFVAVPLGVLCAKNQRLGATITGVFASLRIIPSLAMLLVCIPIMGTGVKPAVTALTFLAIPPLLINTTLGFGSVPPAVLETAQAMGMSARRIFFLVKAPLALPLMLAGLKTAMVEVIASATLAAYIGGGGLGTIIFTGLGLMRSELLLIGGVSVAILSILADFLLGSLEKRALRFQEIENRGNRDAR